MQYVNQEKEVVAEDEQKFLEAQLVMVLFLLSYRFPKLVHRIYIMIDSSGIFGFDSFERLSFFQAILSKEPAPSSAPQRGPQSQVRLLLSLQSCSLILSSLENPSIVPVRSH